MSLQIASPFQQFFDRDGSPLDNGFVYIGTANLNPETNPLTVYFDDALTIPAAQPLRTSNGYIMRNGSPARLYTSQEDFSLTVREKNGVLVYAVADATSLSNLQAQLAAGSGSSMVGYNQGSAGAVNRTVQSRLRDFVSFKDFGAAGDGVADDTAEVLLALNSGARVVDGGGLTYRITAPIAPSSQGILIQNATLDFSDVPDQPGSPDRLLRFSGSMGTASNLSADALAGAFVLTVGSTAGFVADGYGWLSSNTIFESGQAVILGQIVKIKSVDSATQLTLYEDVLYDFTTAATAKVAPLSMKKNIKFQNVKFVGANAFTQSVLDFDMCADVEVTGCTFEFCDYVACRISRTVNFSADNCTVRYARAVGTSYGFAIGNGAYSVKIANSYGEDLRHFVTVGDNDGVNLFVTVTGCHVSACQDAGIDSHSAGDFMVIDGNTIEGSSFDSGQLDGIIFQGLNCVITNNIVVGARRHSIFYQCLPDIGTGSVVISGNQIRNAGGAASTENAIYAVAQPGAGGSSIDGVTISNNVISGVSNQDITVYALSANVRNVAITGNVVNDNSDVFCCLLRADAGYSLEDFTVTGNIFKTSGVSNIYLQGETAPNILNGAISGNVIKGGTNGIRMLQTQNVVETGNYNTGVTRKVFVDAGSSNITMDRRTSSVVTMINSTYIVLDQDEYLIANRAGTTTVTLPGAATWPGRELRIKTIQAQAVDSASSNVAPIGDSVVGTSILPATDGAWALLKSDGTNWIIMQRG